MIAILVKIVGEIFIVLIALIAIVLVYKMGKEILKFNEEDEDEPPFMKFVLKFWIVMSFIYLGSIILFMPIEIFQLTAMLINK